MDIKIDGNPGMGNTFTEVHINNVEVYAPGAGKVENKHTHTVNVQVNINFSFHMHLPFASRLFGILSPSSLFPFRFPLYDMAACGALLCDWRKSDESTHQLSGNPAEIARILWQLYRELGEDALASIRYICKEKSVDSSNLTLHQAIEKAEHDSGL